MVIVLGDTSLTWAIQSRVSRPFTTLGWVRLMNSIMRGSSLRMTCKPILLTEGEVRATGQGSTVGSGVLVGGAGVAVLAGAALGSGVVATRVAVFPSVAEAARVGERAAGAVSGA